MKSLYLGASMLAVAAAANIPASAADMYRGEPGGYKDSPIYVPANTWTGFYVGINGGYGWNDGRGKTTSNAFDGHDTPLGGSGSAGLDRNGGFGGGQIGYNWQREHLVFGIEADLQGAAIRGNARTSVEADPFESNNGKDVLTSVSARSSLDFFGTVRGRLGYAFDNALVYATAGFAYGGVKDSLTSVTQFGFGTPASGSGQAVIDDTRTGFVLGGGLEYALTPAWSLKAEYQYIDLGSSSLATAPVFSSDGGSNNESGSGSLKVDHTYHTVRVGLNYHVGNGYEPLK